MAIDTQLRFDPDALAQVAKDPCVKFVTHSINHQTIEVEKWIPTKKKGELYILRPKLRDRANPYVCTACGEPVLLKSNQHHHHFFSHLSEQAANNLGCPFRSGSKALTPEELDRIRYHGQREGVRHIRAKALIDRTLRADANFTEPIVDKVWKSFIEGWRKPDVRTTWLGDPIVFEVQISNTYPSVVAERTNFYRDNGTLLIWVFDKLPSEWRTLHADTFCANGQHLFVVDEESTSVSENSRKALLRTYRLKPEVVPTSNKIKGRLLLERQLTEMIGLVPFEEFQRNYEKQTLTLFNLEAEEKRIAQKVLCARSYANLDVNELHAQLGKITGTKDNTLAWAALVCAIESLRIGKPIVFKDFSPIQIVNAIHDHYQGVLVFVLIALSQTWSAKVNSSKWSKREQDFRRALLRNKTDEQFIPFIKLLSRLYPETDWEIELRKISPLSNSQEKAASH